MPEAPLPARPPVVPGGEDREALRPQACRTAGLPRTGVPPARCGGLSRNRGRGGQQSLARGRHRGGAHLPSGRFMPVSAAGRRRLCLRLQPLSRGTGAAAARSCSTVTDSLRFLMPKRRRPGRRRRQEQRGSLPPLALRRARAAPRPAPPHLRPRQSPPPERSREEDAACQYFRGTAAPFLLWVKAPAAILLAAGGEALGCSVGACHRAGTRETPPLSSWKPAGGWSCWHPGTWDGHLACGVVAHKGR